jgi:hypothetical protein
MGAREDIAQELTRRLDPLHRVDETVRRALGRIALLKQVPKVKCADGFMMSVQASEFHYCIPRDSQGPWSAVEVGFPSAREELLMPWVEDQSDPTETVYGFVPFETVVDVIAAHGGFAPASEPVAA